MDTTNTSFKLLHQTIRQLRGPDGCPWDRKQTVNSLKKYLHEEFGEIIDAIDNGDHANLCEELGDFLYLIMMLAEISNEENRFTLDDVIVSIDEKLVRRHPHVFGEQTDLSETELRTQWQQIKEAEKRNKVS